MPKKQITKLTPEQMARFPEFIQRWTEIGLSTGDTDHVAGARAIATAYRCAGLQPPRIVWCTSPLAGALTRAVVTNAKPQASVRDSVGATVWASVGASVRDSVGGACYGQHDAGWLSFYAFFSDVCGLKQQTEKLDGLIACAQTVGWFWPHKSICWVTPKARELHSDDRGRLHNADGPALRYPDDWSIYAIHGVRVTQQIVESPQTLTSAQITAESNAEVRRVMLERFGFDRYIQESGAAKIHQDDYGTLWRTEFRDDEPLVMVAVVNSTPEPDGSYKDYWLRVPPAIKRAHEAVAWSFGLSEKQYAPVVQS